MSKRSYQVMRSIQAPAETVWALLTDASTYSSWNDAVISIEGPIELGNTIKLVSTLDPKRTFKLKVSEFQAPSRMVWSDGMPLGLFTGQRIYTVTSTGDNSCEFHMAENFTGPLAGLITKAIPDMTESFNTIADGLKVASEAA